MAFSMDLRGVFNLKNSNYIYQTLGWQTSRLILLCLEICALRMSDFFQTKECCFLAFSRKKMATFEENHFLVFISKSGCFYHVWNHWGNPWYLSIYVINDLKDFKPEIFRSRFPSSSQTSRWIILLMQWNERKRRLC